MGFDYPLGFSNTFLTAVGKLLIILKLFDCLLVVRVKCTYEPAQRQTERRVGGGREGRPPPTLREGPGGPGGATGATCRA